MSRLFGDLIQIGYVVQDIEAAMQHWVEVLQVGPWFYIERLDVPDFQYMGRPSPVELSLALANSGAMQIELIQQRNDAPSLYEEFVYEQPQMYGGAQHLGYGTYDWFHTIGAILGEGYACAQQGTGGSRGRFAYFRTDGFQRAPGYAATGGYPGTIIEVMDLSKGRAELFAGIAAAARAWDGRDPIRTRLPV